MIQKAITGVIAVFITVLVVATIVVPITGGYTAETKTVENPGVPFASVDDGDHTLVITNNSNGEHIVISDGVEVSGFEYLYNSSVTIVYGSNNIIRLFSNGSVQILGVTNQSGQRATIGDVDDAPLTMNISGSGLSVVSNDNKNYQITGVLAYPSGSENAEYSQGTQHYITDDSNVIIAGGYSYDSVAHDFALIILGSADDLTASVVWYYDNVVTVNGCEATISDVVTNLKQIDKITVSLHESVTDTDFNSTYTQFLAPAVVEYDNPNYLDDGSWLALFLIIPVLLFIVPVFVAVRMISGRSD